MRIGIDYDDTIDRDPGLFISLIHEMVSRKHDPVIVTAREYEGSDIKDFRDRVMKAINYAVPVYCTGSNAKHVAVDGVDIWIDDWPLIVTHDTKGNRFVPSLDTQEYTGKRFHAFAEQMEQELRANIHKGNFDAWEPEPAHLISEILHHVNKLASALEDGDRSGVREFSADVGNYMVKAFHLYGEGDYEANQN